MNISATVSVELGLRLVAAEQTIVPLVASLHYSGSDPYAIRMASTWGPRIPSSGSSGASCSPTE